MRFNILIPNLHLTSTNKLILESVNKFCRNELTNYIKKPINNRDLYLRFGEMGLLGPTIKNYNCLGTDYKTYGLMAKEIEYVDSSFRSMFSVQSSLVMNPINNYGTNIAKEKYLPKLSTGEFIGSFGLTEPESGSDANSMKTNAKFKNGNYILNGSKTWITNSPIADVMVIWAKLENKVNGFLIDRNMSGIQTPEINDKMSLKLSNTGMIFLDNVVVPPENKLEITGMKGPLNCLNNARLGISFGVLGAAESCLDTSLDYCLNRNLFGTKLAQKQLVQAKFADMVSEYNLALLASINVAECKDEDEDTHAMISLLKRNNCQKSLNITRSCRDILGGNGISSEYNIFRHMINLETVNTYEGTFDIHSLILGNYITKLKSF